MINYYGLIYIVALIAFGLVGYLRTGYATNPLSFVVANAAFFSCGILGIRNVTFVEWIIICSFMSFLLIATSTGVLRRGTWRPFGRSANLPRQHRLLYLYSLAILLLSALCNFYIIFSLGGWDDYVASLPTRSVSHDSVRVLKLISRAALPAWLLLVVLTLLYRTTRRWIYLSLVTLLLVSVQVSQGGRSAILYPIVGYVIASELLSRPLPIHRAAIFAVGFFVIGGIMEVFRRTYSDLSFDLGLMFSEYMLVGGRYLSKYDSWDLALGTTFVASVTNYVPRSLWPGKPMGGGAYLDDVIMGDQWTLSTITPGLQTELIINFGYIFGPAFFVLGYLGYYLIVCSWFRRLTYSIESSLHTPSPVMVTLYILTLFYFASLLIAEFANATASMLYSVVVIISIRVLSKLRIGTQSQ